MTESFNDWIIYGDDDDEEDEMISFTCKSCGFSEDVPAWVIGEQTDMDLFSGADASSYIPSTYCMKCNGSMIPTSKLNK